MKTTGTIIQTRLWHDAIVLKPCFDPSTFSDHVMPPYVRYMCAQLCKPIDQKAHNMAFEKTF
jgi:hypothetical protein